MLHVHEVAFFDLRQQMLMDFGVNPDKNCHSLVAEVDNLRLCPVDKPIRV
jgi:hypothetical protein